MVSIIIPCYNGEKYVDRCLDCIINQTYKNLQIIIVNDGSTDNSEMNILKRKKEIIDLGMEFNYIKKENGGLGSAINTGLKYVKRKYITLLDIDDYIMPESIELKVKFLEAHDDYSIVRTNGYYVNEDDIYNTSNLFVTSKIEKEEIYIFNSLLEGNTNNWAGSYMVRSNELFNFYPDRNIYESKSGQNLQILMPLSYNGKAGFIDKPLMKYIRQDTSLSQINRGIESEIQKMLGYKDIREYMINLIVSGDEYESYLIKINEMYYRYFMYLGEQYNDIRIMKKYFNELKRIGCLNIHDKISYYNINNKFASYFYRIVNKCKLNIIMK